jgi:hypothetical protein
MLTLHDASDSLQNVNGLLFLSKQLSVRDRIQWMGSGLRGQSQAFVFPTFDHQVYDLH